MNSPIIVVSWWSNCLALNCIEKLKLYLPGRKIFVIQVGKHKDIIRKFRKLLPPDVEEIIYPDGQLSAHWMVLETVVKTIFKEAEGLWFFDHDVFLTHDATEWINKMDDLFSNTNLCIGLPAKNKTTYSITSPAFWISPVRLPENIPSFSPLPLYYDPIANTPYKRISYKSELIKPQYDTLMKVVENLDEFNRVLYFDANSSDLKFSHLGSVYLFAYDNIPDYLREFISGLAEKYDRFYSVVPSEWLNSEDQILLNAIYEITRRHNHHDLYNQ